jgi:hypothetical protein
MASRALSALGSAVPGANVMANGNHGRATVHGFRAVASTLLNEMGFHPDCIERQLAHDERNKVRAAYNHAQNLPERRRMMQQWADYLDDLADGRKVIVGQFGRAG